MTTALQEAHEALAMPKVEYDQLRSQAVVPLYSYPYPYFPCAAMPLFHYIDTPTPISITPTLPHRSPFITGPHPDPTSKLLDSD